MKDSGPSGRQNAFLAVVWRRTDATEGGVKRRAFEAKQRRRVSPSSTYFDGLQQRLARRKVGDLEFVDEMGLATANQRSWRCRGADIDCRERNRRLSRRQGDAHQ
jgi:hypothetical protein